MYNFILQIIVFASLGSIIYLLARAVPRVTDEAAPTRPANFFDKLMAKLPMEKIDQDINSFLAKFLRKSKVIILKIDNFINHRLGKLSKKNGNGKTNENDTPQVL